MSHNEFKMASGKCAFLDLAACIQNGLIYSYSLRKFTVTKNLQKRQVYLYSYTSQTAPLEGMISPRLLLLQRLKDKLSRVLCVLQLSILLIKPILLTVIKLTNKTQAFSHPSVFLGIINLLTYLPEKFSFIIFFRSAHCIFCHHHTKSHVFAEEVRQAISELSRELSTNEIALFSIVLSAEFGQKNLHSTENKSEKNINTKLFLQNFKCSSTTAKDLVISAKISEVNVIFNVILMFEVSRLPATC